MSVTDNETETGDQHSADDIVAASDGDNNSVSKVAPVQEPTDGDNNFVSKVTPVQDPIDGDNNSVSKVTAVQDAFDGDNNSVSEVTPIQNFELTSTHVAKRDRTSPVSSYDAETDLIWSNDPWATNAEDFGQSQTVETDAMRVNDLESSLWRLKLQLRHLMGRLVETGLSREERGHIEAMAASKWIPIRTTERVLETIRSTQKPKGPGDAVVLESCLETTQKQCSPDDYQ